MKGYSAAGSFVFFFSVATLRLNRWCFVHNKLSKILSFVRLYNNQSAGNIPHLYIFSNGAYYYDQSYKKNVNVFFIILDEIEFSK